MSEDNPLHDIDLSAWQVPPSSERLADVVIARVGATEEAIAVAKQQRAQSRRPWIIGGVAGAVVAIAMTVWLIARPRDVAPAEPLSGEVLADRPRHFAVGDLSAELDAGASIRWRREGDAWRIEQRAGTATWKTGAHEVRIDAGATGASVEAHGASLRVEVTMNLSDTRVITTAAATAAAVALATVVVYEGHVKVTDRGQTVVVAPGTTYVAKAPEPAPVVGSATLPQETDQTAIDGQMQALAIAFGDCVANHAPATVKLELVVHPDGSSNVTFLSAQDLDNDCEMRAIGKLTFPPSRRGKVVKHVIELNPPCDAEDLKAHGRELEAQGAHAAALANFKASLRCKPDDTTRALVLMAACNSANVVEARAQYRALSPDRRRQLVQMCTRQGITKEVLESKDPQ